MRINYFTESTSSVVFNYFKGWRTTANLSLFGLNSVQMSSLHLDTIHYYYVNVPFSMLGCATKPLKWAEANRMGRATELQSDPKGPPSLSACLNAMLYTSANVVKFSDHEATSKWWNTYLE